MRVSLLAVPVAALIALSGTPSHAQAQTGQKSPSGTQVNDRSSKPTGDSGQVPDYYSPSSSGTATSISQPTSSGGSQRTGDTGAGQSSSVPREAVSNRSYKGATSAR